jgi:hypothetical protein
MVKQAQEVQQVILPDAYTTLPGLVMESEYRPARDSRRRLLPDHSQQRRWQPADRGKAM